MSDSKVREEITDSEGLSKFVKKLSYHVAEATEAQLQDLILQIVKSNDLVQITTRGSLGVMIEYVPFREVSSLKSQLEGRDKLIDKLVEAIDAGIYPLAQSVAEEAVKFRLKTPTKSEGQRVTVIKLYPNKHFIRGDKVTIGTNKEPFEVYKMGFCGPDDHLNNSKEFVQIKVPGSERVFNIHVDLVEAL